MRCCYTNFWQGEGGVLVIKAKSKVRLLPALNIGWDDLKTAIEIVKKGCEVNEF